MIYNHTPRCGTCQWFNLGAYDMADKGIGKCTNPRSDRIKVCDRTLACDFREPRLEGKHESDICKNN